MLMYVDSSFVPPLVYAVLGSSRDLAVGPVSIASLILGSMLRQQVSPVDNPLLFLQLAFSSTFFAGLFQASLGILRLQIYSICLYLISVQVSIILIKVCQLCMNQLYYPLTVCSVGRMCSKVNILGLSQALLSIYRVYNMFV